LGVGPGLARRPPDRARSATQAGDRACYDHIYHTVDPAIPDLSPEQLEVERKKLGAYKLKLRASREQKS